MKRLPRGIPLWLRILPVKGVGSNPGQGTKVPYAMGCGQFFFNSKKKKRTPVPFLSCPQIPAPQISDLLLSLN